MESPRISCKESSSSPSPLFSSFSVAPSSSAAPSLTAPSSVILPSVSMSPVLSLFASSFLSDSLLSAMPLSLTPVSFVCVSADSAFSSSLPVASKTLIVPAGNKSGRCVAPALMGASSSIHAVNKHRNSRRFIIVIILSVKSVQMYRLICVNIS